MTSRANLTQAQIQRAIRAADREGKVAVQTPIGIAYVDPARIVLPAPEAERPNSCDEAWR